VLTLPASSREMPEEQNFAIPPEARPTLPGGRGVRRDFSVNSQTSQWELFAVYGGWRARVHYASQTKDSGAALEVRGGGGGSPFCRGRGRQAPRQAPIAPHPVGSHCVSFLICYWLRMMLVWCWECKED
jgi:hypothetical protein